MRTGLAFVAAGIVVVSVLPHLVSQIVGYALLIIGFGEVFESFRRLKKKQEEVRRLKKKLKF